MTPEDAAALMAEAGAIDAGQAVAAHEAANPQAPGAALAAAGPDTRAQEWFLVPKMLAWAITAVFPETAPHYTDEKCLELAGAIVPVAEKYGLNGIGDSPELTLLLGTGIFCVPGYLAYKERKEAREAAAEAARRGGAPAGQVAGQATHKPTDEVVRGQHGS